MRPVLRRYELGNLTMGAAVAGPAEMILNVRSAGAGPKRGRRQSSIFSRSRRQRTTKPGRPLRRQLKLFTDVHLAVPVSAMCGIAEGLRDGGQRLPLRYPTEPLQSAEGLMRLVVIERGVVCLPVRDFRQFSAQLSAPQVSARSSTRVLNALMVIVGGGPGLNLSVAAATMLDPANEVACDFKVKHPDITKNAVIVLLRLRELGVV